MRILRNGKEVEAKEYFCCCHNCGCEFLYTRKDVQSHTREGEYIVCPGCGYYITPNYNEPRIENGAD